MPVAQWLILVMGLSTITPDSGSSLSSEHGSGVGGDDNGSMNGANGAGGHLAAAGIGFGSGSHLGQQAAAGNGQGAVGSGGGIVDVGDSSWVGGDSHAGQAIGTPTADSVGDTAAGGTGPAGLRLPAGE